jgi:hypothetical protein
MDIEAIAKICHETNRAFCAYLGDNSQKPWSEAPEWQRTSAINGVKFRLDNEGAPASLNHESWLEEKISGGWVYGKDKDADAKTHPCIVPYEELPPEQQFKDALFIAVVEAAR